MRVVLFLLMALLSACQSSPKQQPKVVKINIGSDPQTLDPSAARGLNDFILAKMLFEGLTRIGSQEEAELALARSIEISADLKTYTFQLNPSLWSNRSQLTASDFVYAWKRALNPSFNSSYASQLYCIKNARGFKEGKVGAEALGVRALDNETLVVELEYPLPYFLKLLATPIFFPICEQVDREHPDWTHNLKHFVSNGPFCLQQWNHADCITVKKNPSYWDANQVKLDGLEMAMVAEDAELKLFEQGALHWAGSPLSTLSVDALHALKQKGALLIKPILGTAFMRINVERLSHPLMRRAFALALHRKEIVDHVLQGEQIPATGLVPPSMHIQEKPYFKDGAVQEARHLFDLALSEIGVTRENFPKVTLTYASSERNHQLVQALQQQWQTALGIQVALEGIERKVYFDRLAKQDFELALGSWMADFDDPINFLELFKHKSHSTNDTKWEDPTYRELLSASFQCMEGAERIQLLSDCEKILIDAMPIIPIYHSSMLYLKDPHLKGVVLSNLGSLDFKWADLETEK